MHPAVCPGVWIIFNSKLPTCINSPSFKNKSAPSISFLSPYAILELNFFFSRYAEVMWSACT